MVEIPIEWDSEERWVTAKKTAALLLPVPPAIVNAIQILWRNHLENIAEGADQVAPSSVTALRMIEKSVVLKTPLYFAASTIFPERTAEYKEDDASRATVNILGPGLYATLLVLIYFHRRLNKVCPKEAWESLSKEMVLNMELGFRIGQKLPKLGGALGVYLGGIRYVALGAMLVSDADRYTRYRNIKRSRFDLPYEHEGWGCDHAQICGYLTQEAGLRKGPLEIGAALRLLSDSSSAGTLPDDLKIWQGALTWIEGVKLSSMPAISDPTSVAIGVTSDLIPQLQSVTEALINKGPTFSWMFRSAKE